MKDLIEQKWEDILYLLETQYDISVIMINTWIRSLKIYEVKDNTIYFYVDEKLGENAVKFIRKKEFDFFLLSSIRETLNNSDLDIVIDEKKKFEKEKETVEKKNIQFSSSYQEAVAKSNLNSRYTFDTFIVGDGNKHAYAACLAVADMPGQDNFNPLFLYGKPGLGKTHLMQSIAHYILQKNDKTNVLYVPTETFVNDMFDAIKNHTTNQLREKYRNVDVLLLDDVQKIIGTESIQNELFNTFNALYNDNKQIILSSDRPPKQLETLEARIISRFECGVPIDIHEPDYETRIAILKNKAELDHMEDIPNEVFLYIAENITNNIRDLEGALHRLSLGSKLMNEEITLESAKETLKDLIDKESAQVEITPEFIIKTVSEHLNIDEADIKSKKRSQDIANARQLAMYLCRNYTVLSLKSIGNYLGGKDHATVISGIKRIENRLAEDSQFKTSVDTIIKKINPVK